MSTPREEIDEDDDEYAALLCRPQNGVIAEPGGCTAVVAAEVPLEYGLSILFPCL